MSTAIGEGKGAKNDAELAAIAAALEGTFGAALVLDGALRIQLVTRAAVLLLGFEPPLGALAPKVLCGTRSERPIAEALARGEPVEALIPSARGEGSAWIRVRALPSRAPDVRSYVLLLEPASTFEGDGASELRGFVTADTHAKQMLHVVERVAREDVTVLVRGETGTGKELIARALHDGSPRHRGPFRALNCAALPPSLLESELFGHARGAFTGAVRDVQGHVQHAHGGTLFLDEVAELPLELQAKLLRTLETRTVIPVGARDPIAVDVRIVSATHRSLRAETEAGRFRSDLLYRLRVVPIHIPPLRERRCDIRVLTERIVAEFSARGRRDIHRVSDEAYAVLEAHDFPGNVRELRNVLEYAFAVGEGPILLPFDLPQELHRSRAATGTPYSTAAPEGVMGGRDPRALKEVRRIEAALERASGHRARAAAILGWSRVTLWRKMRELGVEQA